MTINNLFAFTSSPILFIHSCAPTTSTRLSSGSDVIDLLRQVLYGYISINDLTFNRVDRLTVAYINGGYWVVDGAKRLWVLQTLEELKKVNKIKVKIVPRLVLNEVLEKKL